MTWALTLCAPTFADWSTDFDGTQPIEISPSGVLPKWTVTGSTRPLGCLTWRSDWDLLPRLERSSVLWDLRGWFRITSSVLKPTSCCTEPTADWPRDFSRATIEVLLDHLKGKRRNCSNSQPSRILMGRASTATAALPRRAYFWIPSNKCGTSTGTSQSLPSLIPWRPTCIQSPGKRPSARPRPSMTVCITSSAIFYHGGHGRLHSRGSF